MLGLIFSLDYEIYGNGQGDFNRLMLDPTYRLLDLFDKHNAKLTVMSDVAEIIALKKNATFQSTVNEIENQLVQTVARGHDVQLHIHPAWLNAHHDGNRWILDFSEYALVGLPYERIDEIIREGKQYLENLLQTAEKINYRCTTYRAGNWLMQPSERIIRALESNGIVFDTSVYKWGCGQTGKYKLDYRTAHSNIYPWFVASEDINQLDDERNGLMELPILTQRVFITSMLSWKRINTQIRLRRDAKDNSTGHQRDLGSGKKVGAFNLMQAKKFDFCRLTFPEMKNFISYAENATQNIHGMVPIVAIGHSTDFTDDGDLERFLGYISELGADRVGWTTFNELATTQNTQDLNQLERSKYAKKISEVPYE